MERSKEDRELAAYWLEVMRGQLGIENDSKPSKQNDRPRTRDMAR